MEREARLVRLVDELLEEVVATRRHFGALREAVGEPAAREHAARPQHAPSEAELAAVSMALSGITREEAREHLREDFGIEDADELLDRAPEAWNSDEASPRRRFVRRLRPGR